MKTWGVCKTWFETAGTDRWPACRVDWDFISVGLTTTRHTWYPHDLQRVFIMLWSHSSAFTYHMQSKLNFKFLPTWILFYPRVAGVYHSCHIDRLYYAIHFTKANGWFEHGNIFWIQDFFLPFIFVVVYDSLLSFSLEDQSHFQTEPHHCNTLGESHIDKAGKIHG